MLTREPDAFLEFARGVAPDFGPATAKGVFLVAPGGFADPRVVPALASLYAPHVLALSPAEQAAFAGNAIALSGDRAWMSARAAAALLRGRVALGPSPAGPEPPLPPPGRVKDGFTACFRQSIHAANP